MVSIDTIVEATIVVADYIETRETVQTYLDRLQYALKSGAKIDFQIDRMVDNGRDKRQTNRYTIADLFPNEDPVDALKRELRKLRVEDYIKTVTDTRFPNRSPMYEFGKIYESTKEVYIKIRVETIDCFVFVMSFHYAAVPFIKGIFPYCN